VDVKSELAWEFSVSRRVRFAVHVVGEISVRLGGLACEELGPSSRKMYLTSVLLEEPH